METGIDITAADGGIRISQRRPAVTTVLEGLSLDDALARIPVLLPICGHAQHIAGRRAATAAQGGAASGRAASDGARQEATLYREQALAAAWRLAIDWPARFGQERQLAGLKAAKAAGEMKSLADILRGFLPGLDAVRDEEDLGTWIEQADCPPAIALRQVLHLEAPLETAGAATPRAGEELTRHARDALAVQDFDPLTPANAGIEVGPLAMGRHPLVEGLRTSQRYGVLSRRLLAQILDTLAIADRLACNGCTPAANAWQEAEGVGVGRAITARGPVFHRVRLDPEDHDKVIDWRVLAPTDWHFAPGGPLVREAAALAGQAECLAPLILGFDPCAPWTVEVDQNQHA